METRDAIYGRRSVRSYKDQPIEDTVLQEILEAGTYAPSAQNLQPWYFVVIKSEENKKRLLEIMERVSAATEPNLKARFAKYPDIIKETMYFIRQLGSAPVAVLAFKYKPDYPQASDSIVQSIAAAVENMMLMAYDKGVAGCWLTAPLEVAMDKEIHDVFAPENGSLVAMFALGYADRIPAAPKRRAGRYVII